MGLIRSAPQTRILENVRSGGRPVYPENVPFIADRPMAVSKDNRKDTGVLDILGSITGFQPKHYDLKSYQSLLKERVKYAKSRHHTQSKKLRKSNRGK